MHQSINEIEYATCDNNPKQAKEKGGHKNAYGNVLDRLPPSLVVYTTVIHDKVCRQNATCKQQKFNY